MISIYYYSELVVTGDFVPRWERLYISMFFIAYELLVVLSAATNSEIDLVIRDKISTAQVMTVVSWCIYPIIYLVHMLGIDAASSMVFIQVGYYVWTLSPTVALES